MSAVQILVAQRWVRAFHSEILHANVTTTNGLERQHEHLKYQYLANNSNGSLADLLTYSGEELHSRQPNEVR